jgi:energy-coupling factor transporter transmembrane protein EcfT
MIPFDVDPMLYFPFIIAIIGACILFIMSILLKFNLCCYLSIILFVVGIIASSFFVFGSTYTDTITVCKHISSYYDMTVIDTNENVYYVRDVVTKLKVKDNLTTKVKIKEYWGFKWIYSIDAPITCGNQTCGVVTS